MPMDNGKSRNRFGSPIDNRGNQNRPDGKSAIGNCSDGKSARDNRSARLPDWPIVHRHFAIAHYNEVETAPAQRCGGSATSLTLE